MHFSTTHSLDTLEPATWNRLSDGRNPFLRHEFLHCLERHGALEDNGWTPHHLLAWEDGCLVGAAPMYLKTNSYGEFVFDWAWAEAYQRAGGEYYPKLVSAVPFTPVTGPRLLVADDRDRETVQQGLAEAMVEVAKRLGVSSLHCLFPPEDQNRVLEGQGMMRRVGCQYHWNNRNYQDFADFLAALTAKRRKRIRQERRAVTDAGIRTEVLDGNQIDAPLWERFFRFYCSTFYKKRSEPRLTLDFFQALARAMPDQILLFLAHHRGEIVAAAFAMLGGDTLYGRHWGCSAHHRNLHFELCYYRTIEYCIEKGLKRFDAGAQGEHKVSRGFGPVPTYSTHWIHDPSFGDAVQRYVTQEEAMIRHYIDSLRDHSPYKRDHVAANPAA